MDYRQLTNMQQSTYYMHEPEQESEMVFEIPTYNPSSGGDRNYIDYSQNSFLDISKNWKQFYIIHNKLKTKSVTFLAVSPSNVPFYVGNIAFSSLNRDHSLNRVWLVCQHIPSRVKWECQVRQLFVCCFSQLLTRDSTQQQLPKLGSNVLKIFILSSH